MAGSEWVIDVGEADFEQQVVARSAATPVVVDCWAPWCGPCRTLGPMLERLAGEHAGAFVLAKLNVDEHPALAQRFGVRSIPAVFGIRDGRIVAEFVGAQPEPAVRAFLARLLPSPADRLVAEAATLDAAGAEARLREAVALDPHHAAALVALARRLADRGERAEALDLLARVTGTAAVEREAERLAAELRTSDAASITIDAARAAVAAAPGDARAQLALGRASAAAGHHAEALAAFLAVVQRDRQLEDDAARRAMLDLFEVLGSDDPLTAQYRSELAKALFR